MALRDRAPESDFRGQFSDTETKLDKGNSAMSRHFERSPFQYALDSNLRISEWGWQGLVSPLSDDAALSRCSAQVRTPTGWLLGQLARTLEWPCRPLCRGCSGFSAM
jgi:hypothetical protein